MPTSIISNSQLQPSNDNITIWGYARVSTFEQLQAIDQQIYALNKAGCMHIESEAVSAISPRPKLIAILEKMRPGDVLVVTRMCRLSRSLHDLLKLIDLFEQKQFTLRILDIAVDTSNATGRLIVNILGSVSQFEREILRERQKEGIQRAKLQGVYKGRQPTVNPEMIEQIIEMRSQGKGASEISRCFNISRQTVYRVAGGYFDPEKAPGKRMKTLRQEAPLLFDQRALDSRSLDANIEQQRLKNIPSEK